MDRLNVEGLSVAYQDGKRALHDICFSVPEGAIAAVVGESGSGKSTLLRAVLGLLPAGGRVEAGRILFEGEDIGGCSKEQLRHMRGEQIAMIFQNAGEFLNPRRTVGSQYLEMLRYHLPGSRREHRALALSMLAGLKLPDGERIMTSYPFQLSGGMCQRVAIAMAMSLSPRLLLADEPTSALDVTIQAQVVQEMLQLRKRLGTAIVLVTHNIGLAAHMADYIMVMKGGEQKEFGTREQVIERPSSEYTRYLLDAVPELAPEKGGEAE